jgi:hypothetical protein
MDDTKMAAAQRILTTQIDAMIMQLTGVIPVDGGQPMDTGEHSESTTRKPDGTKTTKTTDKEPTVGSGSPMQALPGLPDIAQAVNGSQANMLADLVTQAFGTKLPQRRIVSANDNDPGLGGVS